jgi:2-hydroxy-6-oxonona-2,4-dienedioate hydrolase
MLELATEICELSTAAERQAKMALTTEGLAPAAGCLSRWARLPSGVRAHYATSGEDGPAVVLLHGGIAGSSGLAGWRSMSAFLGRHGFRVYSPDFPGFGLTLDQTGYYAAGQIGHLDFLHDFTSALCLDRFFLAGNSMGCQNAVNYLLAHPERVERFALIAGAVGDIVPAEAYAGRDTRPASERPNTRAFDGTAESMRTMMGAILRRPDELSDDLVDMRVAAGNRNRDAYARHASATLDAPARARLSTRGRLDRIGIPGIYLYGMNDTLIPVEVRGYLQEDALPDVQFFYPQDCGHQGQNDQPEMFQQLFLEFFSGGVISAQTARWAGVSDRRPVNPDLVAAGEAADLPAERA